MATTLPIYETERGNEGGDVKHVPEVADLNAVITRVNAVAAAITPVAASAVTGIVGDNNSILWTAAHAGIEGNDITVAIAIPAGAGAALGVTVDGNAVTVHSGTAGAGVGNSTAADVIAAVAGVAAAAALVTTDNNSTSDGSGVVVGERVTSLTGGQGFPNPLAPVVAS